MVSKPVYQSFKTDYKAALAFGNAERLKAANQSSSNLNPPVRF
jgi:hypothetical protein